jgi:hypothetical protein
MKDAHYFIASILYGMYTTSVANGNIKNEMMELSKRTKCFCTDIKDCNILSVKRDGIVYVNSIFLWELIDSFGKFLKSEKELDIESKEYHIKMLLVFSYLYLKEDSFLNKIQEKYGV